MDFRAPNSNDYDVPQNNDETSSNVSSFVISNQPQGPFGAMPMPIQQAQGPTNNPFFRSDLVSHTHQGQQIFDPSNQLGAQNFPVYPSLPYNTSIGYGEESSNHNVVAGGPFSLAQLMELQNQTFIFKYISANEPVPHHLLAVLTGSMPPSAAPGSHSSNPRRLGSGRSDDPQPWRCRRTDGKKWRCARNAVFEQKYCERHMNRGRYRARRFEPAQRPAPLVSGTMTAPFRIQPPTIQHQLGISGPADGSSSVFNMYVPNTGNVDGGFGFGAELVEPARRILQFDSIPGPTESNSFLNFRGQEARDQYSFIDEWVDQNLSAVNWPDLPSDWSQLTPSNYNPLTLQDNPPLSPLTLPQENDPVQVRLGESSDVSQHQTDRLTFGQGTSKEGPSSSKSSYFERRQ